MLHSINKTYAVKISTYIETYRHVNRLTVRHTYVKIVAKKWPKIKGEKFKGALTNKKSIKANNKLLKHTLIYISRSAFPVFIIGKERLYKVFSINSAALWYGQIFGYVDTEKDNFTVVFNLFTVF